MADSLNFKIWQLKIQFLQIHSSKSFLSNKGTKSSHFLRCKYLLTHFHVDNVSKTMFETISTLPNRQAFIKEEMDKVESLNSWTVGIRCWEINDFFFLCVHETIYIRDYHLCKTNCWPQLPILNTIDFVLLIVAVPTQFLRIHSNPHKLTRKRVLIKQALM